MTMTVESFVRQQLHLKKGSPEWALAMPIGRMVEETRQTWESEKMDWVRRHCKITSKNPSLGWKTAGPRGRRRVVPDLREQRVMRAILEWRRQLYSWREIYDHLRQNKVRTRKGKVWSVMRIRRACCAALALESLAAEPSQDNGAGK